MLAESLRRDGLFPHPELLVTFLDNHDTPRLAAVPGVTTRRLMMAVAFLLTTRGIPQITWGDELGLPGHMDDRRDFPGGFPGDPRDAFAAAGRTTVEQEVFAAYRDLLRLRKATPSLRGGTLTDLVATETVYAYLRQRENERVVVALEPGEGPGRGDASAGHLRAGRATIWRGAVVRCPGRPSSRAAGRGGRGAPTDRTLTLPTGSSRGSGPSGGGLRSSPSY